MNRSIVRRCAALVAPAAFACSVGDSATADSAPAAVPSQAVSQGAVSGRESARDTGGPIGPASLGMDTLLRQFRAGLSDPGSLGGTESSADALVRRFIEAVSRSDTGSLAGMIIDRSEYAYLYFPTSKLAAPPYSLDPGLAWPLMRSESERSIRATLNRFGGQPMAYVSHACAEAVREGATIIWRRCTVRWRGPGRTPQEGTLFSSIIERGGRFKFFGYANRL